MRIRLARGLLWFEHPAKPNNKAFGHRTVLSKISRSDGRAVWQSGLLLPRWPSMQHGLLLSYITVCRPVAFFRLGCRFSGMWKQRIRALDEGPEKVFQEHDSTHSASAGFFRLAGSRWVKPFRKTRGSMDRGMSSMDHSVIVMDCRTVRNEAGSGYVALAGPVSNPVTRGYNACRARDIAAQPAHILKGPRVENHRPRSRLRRHHRFGTGRRRWRRPGHRPRPPRVPAKRQRSSLRTGSGSLRRGGGTQRPVAFSAS